MLEMHKELFEKFKEKRWTKSATSENNSAPKTVFEERLDAIMERQRKLFGLAKESDKEK